MRSTYPSPATRAPLRLIRLATLLLVLGPLAAQALPTASEPDRVADISAATPAPLSEGESIGEAIRAVPYSSPWKRADDTPVWKTIRLGTYASVNGLRDALESKNCGAGDAKIGLRNGFLRKVSSPMTANPNCRLNDTAGEIIDRPAFRLSRTTQELDLVIVSLAELGFADDEDASLEDIQVRADMLGFALCPAEAGPQLRLQYLNQPVGERLRIGMDPISRPTGEPADFAIGNDGNGLMLVADDARANLVPPATTRFVFVRPRAPR